VPIEAVYFDIGETLADRSREYAALAATFGVSPHTYSAVFGAVVAGGGTVRDVVARFRDEHASHGDSLAPLSRTPAEWAESSELIEDDLYPDARACLGALHARGLRVGIVGNQPARIARQLGALELPVDEIATSEQWGVSKPDLAFFDRIVRSAGVAPASIVYVGDQLDLDIVPALDAGMHAVRILRGPWGMLVRDPVVEASCLAVIRNLSELPAVLAARHE
jgi:FMN phosphatase YigB (HAD superfamily)